jgi:hypothetical protein
MTESIANKERRLASLAEGLIPDIVEGLRRGDPALKVAQSLEAHDLAQQNPDVDLKTLYRWVMFVEERLEKKRRRVGVLAAALLWVGFLALLAGVAGVTTALAVPVPRVAVLVGCLIIIGGIAVWRVGKRRVGVTAGEIIS